MRLSTILLPLAAVALLPAAAIAQDGEGRQAEAQQEAGTRNYIPFPNHGGVWDWHADGQDVIYFQDRQKRWYRAELFTPAYDLPWVQFIGIETRGTDRLDKWSTIYIRGQRYSLKSFEMVSGAKPWEAEEADEAAEAGNEGE